MENAYKNKFVDRYPCTRAAGKLTKNPGDAVSTCMKFPEKHLVFFIEKEKDAVCKAKDQPEICIQRGKRDDLQSELWKIMKANDMSALHCLSNELNETVYASYWKAPLGRRQHLPIVPECFNPETLTHGVSTEPSIPGGDIINPRKSHAQVLHESEIGKACYKISHDSYDPGEQVKRKYDVCCKNFNSCTRFGMNSPHFNDGRKMRRVLRWINEDPISYVSVRQADFNEKHKAHLGKARPFDHCQALRAPEHSKFGICLKTNIDASQLLGGVSQCSPKHEQLMSLQHINSLRVNLKKRHFPFKELFNSFKNHDQECGGLLSITEVDKICRTHHIYINKPIIKLLETLGILNDKQCVDVAKFVDILNWQRYFPDLPKINESEDRHFDYGTIQSMSMTGEKVNTSGIRPAGLPSAPADVTYPRTRRELRVDRGNLEGETDVYAVISPSIFTTYGLSHRDFFKPRCSAELEKIFCGIGVELPSGVFNELWKEGCCIDQTGGVCVETFRNLLHKYAAKNLLST